MNPKILVSFRVYILGYGAVQNSSDSLLHVSSLAYYLTSKTEEIYSSETLADFHRATLSYIPVYGT
jgi:hypothetical protein